MSTGILILGSGALATLFAARLSEAGVNVTMLASWPEGLTALRNRGVCLVDGKSFPVRATDNPIDCRGSKLALVLVKSWQTERAAHQLADCLAGDGLAITLQNGLGNDAILSEAIGKRRVFQGVTTLGATLLEPGLVRSSGVGEVTLTAHPRLDDLAKILCAANLYVRVVKNVQPFVWGKLVVNAAINPLTAILRMKNGELLGNPPAYKLMREIAHEAASVGKALGVELPFLVPEDAVEDVAKHTADNISSMLQDVLRGAQTEVDAINGAIIRKGKQKGVLTPANRVVWLLVKALPRLGKI